jgi:hypothetical protein
VARGPYLDLLSSLAEAGVRYAVAGGFAAVLHGVPRLTFDLDLVLDLSDDNMAAVVGVLRSCGYRPRLPVPLEALANPETRRGWVEDRNLVAFSLYHPDHPMEEIDLLLVAPAWEEIAATNVTRQLEDVAVSVLGRKSLQAMKRAAGREKDLIDADLLDGDVDG